MLSPDPKHVLTRCADSIPDSTALPIERFAGRYFDLGYGSLELCSSTSDSPSCAQVLSDFGSISLNGTLNPNDLYGITPRVWGSHVRTSRTACINQDNSESFAFSLGTIFPNGYGRDITPFADGYLDVLQVEFRCVVDDDKSRKVVGCGIMNMEEGIQTPQGTTVREMADVRFQKLE